MDKRKLDNQLIEALDGFKQSYINLIIELRNTTDYGRDEDQHRIDSITGPHYPFDESLDDLQVTNWVDASIAFLRNRQRKFAVSSELHERRIYDEDGLRELANHYYNNMDSEEVIDIESLTTEELVSFIGRVDQIEEI